MAYICVTYDDGKFIECVHVTDVSYNGSSSTITVSGDDILGHTFPVGKGLWIKTQDGITCVRGDGIRSIQITKD